MNRNLCWPNRPVAAAALVALGVLVGCQEEIATEPVVKPVKTVTAGGATEGTTRIFPGTVQATRRARLSFRVSGPLVELPVSPGQRVGRGALLAQIDPRDFDTQARNLEARLANLRAQRSSMNSARPEDIRRLEAASAGARARLLEAEATFRRYQRLYENDNVSKAQFDQRRAARDVAAADAQSAEEALNIGRIGARPEDIDAMDAQIRASEAQLQQANDSLRDASLIAPFDGVVADTFVENFEYVAARQEILSLQDMSTVETVAQIPEAVVAAAREGVVPTFTVRFGSLPDREFDARITEFSTDADPVTRTYSVTFESQQPADANILAGMTGEVVLHGAAADESAFTVPVSAVFTDENGQQSVWVVDQQSMAVEKVSVGVGDLSGGSATILTGIRTGDQIVTAGASYLSEGQTVREITDELRERR